MEHTLPLHFEPFQEQDIKAMTAIMKRAFDEDTRLHLQEPEGGPPGYDTGEFLSRYCFMPTSHAHKILLDKRVIGLFNVFINPGQCNYLGTLFLEPEHQNRGIGLRVWHHIESGFPRTRLWETETPGFSKRNHGFYVNKCGFVIHRIANPGSRHEEMYLMRKEMPVP